MNKRLSASYFWQFLLLFGLASGHYSLWVKVVEPLPDHGGQFEYYYPVLNYLRTAGEVGNNLEFLISSGFEYSYGISFICWLVVELGLAEQLLLRPFLLNIICILPFVGAGFFFVGAWKKRFLIGLIICFFPFVQICIKQFSLHGLVVAYSFLALLFFRSWLSHKKWYFLLFSIFFFWFAAILKPSGLLFMANFIVVYVVWGLINSCFSIKIFFLSLTGLCLTIPFYRPDDLGRYVMSSLRHNPFIVAYPFAGVLIFLTSLIFLILIPPALAFYLRKHGGKKGNIPKIFRYKTCFLLLLSLSCAIVICDLFRPATIAFFGYGAFLPLVWFYRFKGVRGFIYLYAFLTLIPMLMLYRSSIGRMPYIVFLPLLLMLVQFISENDRPWFRRSLLILVLIGSNFFPSFQTMDYLFGKCGREFYLTLFHGPHQNPLGWHNYGFGAMKKEFTAVLSQYSFAREPLFLVENFAPFSSAQFAFYTNVLYSFPPMQILEWVEQGKLYRRLYERYLKEGEGLFDSLYENGDIPILFYAKTPLLNERGFKPFLLEELIKESEFSIETENDDLFVIAFNQSLLNYFIASGRMENDYECWSIPSRKPMSQLCIDRRVEFLAQENNYDYGEAFLQEIINRRGEYFLDQAWVACNRGEPVKAHKWLLQVGKLKVNSEDLRNDIDIIAQTLWDRYGYNIYTASVDR